MNPFPSGQTQNPSDLKFENLTRDELKKIQKSMKKPQFMGLLNEYMVEISDPKNRQQYDQYLRQMEKQGQLPKNMKLVELIPYFCIRTNIVSEKNKKHNMKFFINYCSTQYLQQPICQPTQNQQGKTVFGWKVPNSMGKIRYDQDKNGNPCQVADVAFNPKCFEIIEAQSKMPFRKNQFKSMVVIIGLQCAQKQLGQRKQTLSKDYDILKKLKCKGEKPALLPLRYIKGKVYSKGQGPDENIIERSTQGKQTKLQKQINQSKQKHQNQKKQEKKQQNEMQEYLQDKKVFIQDLQQGLQQPKYSTIYTYPVDYSQFMQDPVYMKSSKIPSHFTVQFKLPRVEGLQQIGSDGLNVNQNRIILKIGQKYFIDLPFELFKLKYKLLTDKIKAKFDKKKKVLRIIIQVDLSIKFQQQVKNKQQLVNEVQQNLSQNILSNQSWKNKVLQVSQPSVDLKLIEQKQQEIAQPEQPAKKLIQQIDQDDQNEEDKIIRQKQSQSSQKASNFQQALQDQKMRAFTLRKYYKDQKKDNLVNNQLQQTKKLTFVFQETNDRVILIVKMQNYNKDQVSLVYNEEQNNNFFLQWNTNKAGSLQLQLSKIHIINFKIDQQFSKDIKSLQIVYRINFLALFIHKSTINKFWEKTSIKENIFSQSKNKYETFKLEQQQIQNFNKQRRLRKNNIQQKQQQIEQKTNIDNKQQHQSQQQQKLIIPHKQEDNPEKQNIYEVDQSNENLEKTQNIQKQQAEYFNFNNLPPQFIHFDINFIETMD